MLRNRRRKAIEGISKREKKNITWGGGNETIKKIIGSIDELTQIVTLRYYQKFKTLRDALIKFCCRT